MNLWAGRFDGTLDDVFALQDTVANAVASQIEPAIQGQETRRANARPTEDLSAYDLYLRALASCQRLDRKTYDQGLELFDRAIARDPNYALALATAASFHAFRASLDWSRDRDGDRRNAIEYRARALRVAPDDPDVLTYGAVAAVLGGMDKAIAVAAADRALALNAGSSFAWFASGLVHAYGGQGREALVRFEKSLRLDPRSPWRPLVLDGVVVALLSLRRFDEAVVVSREVCDLLPSIGPSYTPLMASALANAGRLAEAKTAAEAAARIGAEHWAVWQGWLSLLAPDCREFMEAGLALAQRQLAGGSAV